jgi:hypothetical protein
MFSTRILSYWTIALTWGVFCLSWPAPSAMVHGQDGQPAPATNAAADKIFLIGNSLTWDTLPGLLDGDVQWHVDCGKNLQYIFDNPANPCVKTSTLWTEALKNRQFDILCVQPYSGTTIEQDVHIISTWLALQPTAALVIHTGWNRADDFEQAYHASDAVNLMTHSPAYFQTLQTRLQTQHPERTIRLTAALDVLDTVWHDIELRRAPFQSFGELYRDNVHMTTQVGRYLMHNVMRVALQQPLSEQGFQIEATQKAYFDKQLNSLGVQQPGSL